MTATVVQHASPEAERAVLASVLLEPASIDEAATLLPSGAPFAHHGRALIWDAMLRLSRRNGAIDLVTLRQELHASGELVKAGGDEELLALCEHIPSVANVEHYARIVHDLASVRGVCAALAKLRAEAAAPIDEPREWCIGAEAAVSRAVAQHTELAGPVPLKDCVIETFERVTAMAEAERTGTVADGAPLPTGFAGLDQLLGGGLRGGQLIVIAGRPGMGKTAFALNVAANLGRAEVPGAIFSLEMSRDELTQRMIASESRVDASHLRIGKLARDEWTHVGTASNVLSGMPLSIDDTATATIAYVRAICRRLHARGQLAWAAIDYLQLMKPTRHLDKREGEVAEISRGAKLLAKELAIPVLLLSQLNRGLESRADKRPMLADLRESGAIEQDADVVAFLYREELYARDNPDVRGLAEIIIGKQRSGPVGVVQARYHAEHVRFEEAGSHDAAAHWTPVPDASDFEDSWHERVAP